jgi:hypothetical protein
LLQRQTCSLSPGASSRCFFQQPIIRDPTSKKHFTLGTSFFFFPQRTTPTSTPCGDLLSGLSHQTYLFGVVAQMPVAAEVGSGDERDELGSG